MSEPQVKMLDEQPRQSKGNLKLTPIAKAVPIIIGTTIALGFGNGIYKVTDETTGWGLYSISTFCVGTLIAGAIGGLARYVAIMAITLFGFKVKV